MAGDKLQRLFPRGKLDAEQSASLRPREMVVVLILF